MHIGIVRVERAVRTVLMASLILIGAFHFAPLHAADETSSTPTYLQVDFPSTLVGFVTAEKDYSYWLETTTDGGATWQSHPLGFGIRTTPVGAGQASIAGPVIDFISPASGWVAGLKGHACSRATSQAKCDPAVFQTTNGGTAWKRILTLSHPESIDSLQMVTKKIGWVLSGICRPTSPKNKQCHYQQIVRETRNGGRTWRTVHWGDGAITQLDFSKPSTGLMATGVADGRSACTGRLFRTSSGGGRWTRVLQIHHQCSMVFSFATSTVGWVATSSTAGCTSGGCPEYLRTTSNGGKTWTQTEGASNWTGDNGFVQGAGMVQSDRGFLTFALGTNLNSQGGIATTNDGGKTWTRSYPCYSVAPGGASAPSSDTVWLAGSWVSYCSQPRGTGLFESTNWGQQWKQVTTGL